MFTIKSFARFSVRKMVAFALAYDIVRYSITLSGNCSEHLQKLVDAVLKGILKSVAYTCAFPKDVSLFDFLGMPSFRLLFVQAVISFYLWSSDFKNANVPCRTVRKSA